VESRSIDQSFCDFIWQTTLKIKPYVALEMKGAVLREVFIPWTPHRPQLLPMGKISWPIS